MDGSNKRIARNTIFMYLRMFVTMSVSLYTSRIVLQTLGIEDYGLYNVIGGVIAMFGFLNGAMTNTTSRFITVSLAKDDDTHLNQIFNLTFLIHVVIAIVICFAGETIGLWYLNNKLVVPEGRMNAAQWLYQLTIITAILNILYVPYNAVIIAHEKMNAFAYISVIDVFLKLIIVFLLAFSPFDRLIFYGTCLALISCFDLGIYFLYCKRNFKETKLAFYWNSSKFKEMIVFAGWGTIGNFSYVFYTQGINLMLNLFCGPVVNAARGISLQVDGVVRQFANNVQVAINPQIMKSYASNDLERTYLLIYTSSRLCFYLLFLLSLPIMIEAQFVLNTWLGVNSVPEHTVNFIRIILATALFDAFINPMFTANLASGKLYIYQICVCSVSYVFMFITYYTIKNTLIPESVFICLLISTVIGVTVRLFVLKKQIGLNPKEFVSNVFNPIIYVVITSLILPIILHSILVQGWLRFFIVLTTSVIMVIISVYINGINTQEKAYVEFKIKSILNRINGKR